MFGALRANSTQAISKKKVPEGAKRFIGEQIGIKWLKLLLCKAQYKLICTNWSGGFGFDKNYKI